MIDTIIQIRGTVKATEADWAFTTVVGPVVNTAASVLTWVVSFCAKWDFRLAVFSHESRCTVASVGLNEVHAG